jgi:two-component system, sensor histidine kinase and response regulator
MPAASLRVECCPVAVLVPAGLGWLTLAGHRAGLFSEALGLAIAAAVTMFAFAAFIATTSRSLSRADRVRKASERYLAAQNVTTCVLVESATLADAMPRVLEAVCQSLGWVMGVRWSVDAEAKVLRCAEMHVASPQPLQEMVEVTRRATFPSGVGLPGRVWNRSDTSRRPEHPAGRTYDQGYKLNPGRS